MIPIHQRVDTLEIKVAELTSTISNLSTLVSNLQSLFENSQLVTPETLQGLQLSVNQLSARLDQLQQIYPAPPPLPQGWVHPNYPLRIKAEADLIMTDTGVKIKAWFDLNQLPVVLQNDNYVYLYCNTILDAHKLILKSLIGQIVLEELVENTIVEIDINTL